MKNKDSILNACVYRRGQRAAGVTVRYGGGVVRVVTVRAATVGRGIQRRVMT
jgi:hypothetical protein